MRGPPYKFRFNILVGGDPLQIDKDVIGWRCRGIHQILPLLDMQITDAILAKPLRGRSLAMLGVKHRLAVKGGLLVDESQFPGIILVDISSQLNFINTVVA